jgi:hypothetical protein
VRSLLIQDRASGQQGANYRASIVDHSYDRACSVQIVNGRVDRLTQESVDSTQGIVIEADDFISAVDASKNRSGGVGKSTVSNSVTREN